MGELEFPTSKLFSLKDLPPIDTENSKIHISYSYQVFNPLLSHMLTQLFPKVRFDEASFPGGMPLVLAGEGKNLVVPLIINGLNYIDALQDIFNLHAFTQSNFGLSPNSENVSILNVSGDSRQDKPTLKPISTEDLKRLLGPEVDEDSAEYFAAVVAQTSWSKAVASMMSGTAGVKQMITIDGHSHVANEQFREAGIEVTNVTTAKLMIEVLRHNRLIDEQLGNIVVGVDFGNLALANKLSLEEGFELGIIRKRRIPGKFPGSSTTTSELVWGNVHGKRVILMDDMIGSRGTIVKTIKILLDAGAAEIIVGASHAMLTGDYYDQLREVIANDKVKLVLLSDTLPLERPKRGENRDLPYLPASAGREQKSVEMMPTGDYITWLIGVMLAHPHMAERKQAMQTHVLEHEDPLDLYERITSRKIPRPKIVAKYREGAELEAL